MRIVISSGHGKHVSGAIGLINEVVEARRVVDRVAALVRESGGGIGVFHDDTSRNQRDNINTIVRHHNSQERVLDVSVHLNAFQPTRDPRGTEVLHRNQHELARRMSQKIAEAGGFINRGPKQRTDLGFLNSTNNRALLIEVCFVDSEADVALYLKNFEQICKAISVELLEIIGVTPKPPAPSWPLSEENIQAMVELGVISSPDYWNSITSVRYLNELLGAAARPGLLDPRIQNGITSTDTALQILEEAGIINTPAYWQNLLGSVDTPEFLDQLLINMANRARIILEKIIQAEARGEDQQGQVLVGNVIMNRHNSPLFPDGIYNVVFQGGTNSSGAFVYQFSPIGNGAYSSAIPSQSVKEAVDLLLDGMDESRGALFFTANSVSTTSWHSQSRTKLFTHGGHTFFA